MRRALLALCSLFLLTTAGTCDSTSTEPTAIVGTYALTTIDTHALPTTFEEGTVTAGSATVGADNTFSFSVTFQGLGSVVVASGTWSQSGSTYTFHPTNEQNSEDGQGTLSGSTLTITSSDHVFVLTKN